MTNYMTIEDAQAYHQKTIENCSKLNINELKDQSDRTLAFGETFDPYDHSSLNMHVYIKDGFIHVIEYIPLLPHSKKRELAKRMRLYRLKKEFLTEDLNVIGGSYHWATDKEFAELMYEKVQALNLSDDYERTPNQLVNGYYGEIKE